jgi:hypothetical protein
MLSRKSTEIIVTSGTIQEAIRDRKLSSTIRRAFELYRNASAVEQELSLARDFIAARARDILGRPRGSVSFSTGDLTCRVTSRLEAVVPNENVSMLRKLLGRRFNELVRTSKKYVGSMKLLDFEDSDVSGLLSVRELSPRFNWRQDLE